MSSRTRRRITAHHTAAARLVGITALRPANADILPFQYSSYDGEFSGYLDQLNAHRFELYGEENQFNHVRRKPWEQ